MGGCSASASRLARSSASTQIHEPSDRTIPLNFTDTVFGQGLENSEWSFAEIYILFLYYVSKDRTGFRKNFRISSRQLEKCLRENFENNSGVSPIFRLFQVPLSMEDTDIFLVNKEMIKRWLADYKAVFRTAQ